MPDLSPDAKARAARTVEVAEVFADNAEAIVASLTDVPDDHVLVAVVDDAYKFTGTHQVPKADMVERVITLEGGGWAMVFTPGADVDDVRRRAGEMAGIARARIASIDKITGRRSSK